MKSFIPCEEYVDGKPCGKTPTHRVEAEVFEGRNGAVKRSFHFCQEHMEQTYAAGLPEVMEDWMIDQRRDQ